MRTRNAARHKAPTPPRITALRAVIRLWCRAYSRATIPNSLLALEHAPLAVPLGLRLLEPMGGVAILGLVTLETVRWVRRGGIATVRDGLRARPARRDRLYAGQHRQSA